MKTFVVTFKGKSSQQRMTLQARDQEEAQRLAERAQFRRLDRFPLTFDRLQQAHENGDLSKEQLAAEMEKRQRDQDRYDGELKLVSVEERK